MSKKVILVRPDKSILQSLVDLIAIDQDHLKCC